MDDELAELVDEARRAEAVAERRRARWLAEEAVDGLTLAGALAAMAGRDEAVVVVTVDGERRQGPVLAVGVDLVVLGGPVERLVPLGAVSLVHADATLAAPTDGIGAGVRTASVPATSLADALGALAAERWPVVVRASGAGPVRGRAWGAGDDVLVVRTDEGRLVHLALAAVCEVLLR